jgi:hypothetical protein
MKISEKVKDSYIFTTNTSTSSTTTDEFVVEFFEHTPDQCCDGAPTKVIKNFGELIDFIEQFDEFHTRID